MPDPATRAAKRRQALGIAAFLVLLTAGVSALYHVARAEAVSFRRGETAYSRGDYAAAAAHYGKARAGGLRSDMLDWHQANSLLALGRLTEAYPILRVVLARDPRNPAALSAAVGAAQASGDPAAGIGFYAALGPRENLPPADLARLADLYQQAGQLEDAVACLRLALAATPSADQHVWLGRLLARDGRRAEARAEFETALRLDPDHRSARLALARVLAWDGDYAAAADSYRTYLGEN